MQIPDSSAMATDHTELPWGLNNSRVRYEESGEYAGGLTIVGGIDEFPVLELCAGVSPFQALADAALVINAVNLKSDHQLDVVELALSFLLSNLDEAIEATSSEDGMLLVGGRYIARPTEADVQKVLEHVRKVNS